MGAAARRVRGLTVAALKPGAPDADACRMGAVPRIELPDAARAEIFRVAGRSVDGELRDARGEVVGSFHGRPDGGIAPGDGDPVVALGPGRYAYVVDAVRGWEAVYERRDGGVLAQLSGGPTARPAPRRHRRARRPGAALACLAAVTALALAAALVVQRGTASADAAPRAAAGAAVSAVGSAAAHRGTGSASTFDAAAATTSGRRTVRRGDTLSAIAAARYGTTRAVHGLAAANGIADPDVLRAGARLTLPPAGRLR